MKHRLLYIAVALIAIITSGRADNLGYTKAQPLLFGLDIDYAPLQYVDKDGFPHGFDVEFTQELMRRLNIPFIYSPNAWENISGDVLSGRVDLAMMVYSPYRKELTNYSKAVFRLYYQIVYRKEEKGSFDTRNLAGKSVAYMASRPLTDTLTKAGATPYIIKDLHKAMRDLSSGKYDAILCFRYQAKYIISHYGLTNLAADDLTLTPREYCYVSHNRQLIKAIDNELAKMETDGTINDIYGDDITSQFGSIEIPRWVWYAIVCLVVTFLIVFIFIQNRHQKRLRLEMERAQRSERLKTIFLGNVSHALRTPLNAIIGFSDVLRTTPKEALTETDEQQMLGLINDNGRQLLYFIDELLQLSNIEANDLQFERIEVSVGELMEELAEEARRKAQLGVEVKVEGDDSRVVVDTKFMRLVTMHCLDNATRHTKNGTITLAYKVEHNGIRITVTDTGEGIPESLRENIFSLLADKNTYIQNEVPGLGLSICKAIVDRCGGRIGAESPPGGGTVIWYWVPCKIIGK